MNGYGIYNYEFYVRSCTGINAQGIEVQGRVQVYGPFLFLLVIKLEKFRALRAQSISMTFLLIVNYSVYIIQTSLDRF